MSRWTKKNQSKTKWRGNNQMMWKFNLLFFEMSKKMTIHFYNNKIKMGKIKVNLALKTKKKLERNSSLHYIKSCLLSVPLPSSSGWHLRLFDLVNLYYFFHKVIQRSP